MCIQEIDKNGKEVLEKIILFSDPSVTNIYFLSCTRAIFCNNIIFPILTVRTLRFTLNLDST